MNASKLARIALIVLGVALVAVIVRLALPDAGSGVAFETLPENRVSDSASTSTTTAPVNENTATETADLQITNVKEGDGAQAVSGKEVTVHYVGTLTDGTKFDSSRDRGTPFTFTLGAGEVIKGWDAGVAGMKVGGVRRLVIPPALAYGDRAVGSIPANSTLVFEVELLGVE